MYPQYEYDDKIFLKSGEEREVRWCDGQPVIIWNDIAEGDKLARSLGGGAELTNVF